MRRSSSAPRAALAALTIVAASTATAALSPAGAQIAPGSTLHFFGTADATDLGSPGVLLDFAKRVTADPLANTGSFASLNKKNGKGANGSIENVTVGSGPQSIRKFLQFGPYKFDLAVVPSGPYGQDECYVAPAVGQQCTPYQFPSFELSPFYIENVSSGSSDAMFTALVSFDVIGRVTGRGTTSDFFGTITTTIEGLSYQEALAGLEQDGLEDVPFSGTFVAGSRATALRATSLAAAVDASVVPEPSTAALVAIGLAGIAGVARRRRTRGS